MGEKTGISWTDHTWNPWHGCLKVSPGCKFCYMYRDKERYGQDPTVVVRSKTKFDEPLKWQSGMVFTCSWSDFFIEQADEWRPEAWDIIRRTPHLTYQILTKRPELISDRLPADWGDGWEHVWIGVSVESQKYADERIPHLLHVPLRTRFLSVEPMLGPVSLDVALRSRRPISFEDSVDRPSIDWVICGGESGPKRRAFEAEWARRIRDQCKTYGAAFFMKQMSALTPDEGKRLIPVDLMINEFPASRLLVGRDPE